MSTPTPITEALRGKFESILFAAGKPLALKKLADMLGVTVGDVEAAARELNERYREAGHGLEVILHQGEALMVTRPEYSDLVRQFLKVEELGELTRPQLEALSVLAYRGPLSKPELEQVRGVNCSLILRNLMIRGLVEVVGEDGPVPHYQVTVDFIRYLGLSATSELPEYDTLSRDENLGQAIVGIVSEPAPTEPVAKG
ncbi:MAG: SMC-Scp complex subunit ScpB [Candidatus Veblenbacteria bacterium]|nr:SMC-Scp complex subunit ScpB [Candidatus Veblenbacteria bacterium]MDZ4229772.1 SMC-Scp complex subunit ScpB [Candidatus Veblenbacteria bacterium]